MTIKINLNSLISQVAAAVFSLGLTVALFTAISAEFIVGTLTDNRYEADYELLIRAAEILPNSARLLARLAETETREQGGNLESAERHIRRAVELSPNNYHYRLLLASIKEEKGNLPDAEQSLKTAVAMAPYYSDVHWKLANLLIREGKTADAVEHFRFVAAENPRVLPSIFDLLWNVSNQNLEVLKKISENNSSAEIKLALFLAAQGRISETVETFNRVDAGTALQSIDSQKLIDLLIKNDYPKAASDLWKKMALAIDEGKAHSIVWNGGFEAEIPDKQSEVFNWQLKNSDYARVGVDGKTARSGGSRSLLLEFTGKDTTRLNNEIRHLVVLDPGVKYRLECYVKTENLETPEGPKIVVADKSGKVVAESEPIPAGSRDWTRMTVNFTAPPKGAEDAPILFISLKRQPRYAYDDPTRGRIWFDDFLVTEATGK